MANNDRKQLPKSIALGCNKLRIYFSIVINLLRRCSTKKYQEPFWFLDTKQRTRILLIFKRGFYPIISVNQRYQSIRLISVPQNCSKNLFFFELVGVVLMKNVYLSLYKEVEYVKVFKTFQIPCLSIRRPSNLLKRLYWKDWF